MPPQIDLIWDPITCKRFVYRGLRITAGGLTQVCLAADKATRVPSLNCWPSCGRNSSSTPTKPVGGSPVPDSGGSSPRRIERSIGSKCVAARTGSSIGSGCIMTARRSVIVWPVTKTCFNDAQVLRPSSQGQRPSMAGRHRPQAILRQLEEARQAHLANPRQLCRRLSPNEARLRLKTTPSLTSSPFYGRHGGAAATTREF